MGLYMGFGTDKKGGLGAGGEENAGSAGKNTCNADPNTSSCPALDGGPSPGPLLSRSEAQQPRNHLVI